MRPGEETHEDRNEPEERRNGVGPDRRRHQVPCPPSRWNDPKPRQPIIAAETDAPVQPWWGELTE